ncbi:MAG: hypothetical protein N3A70_06785 [Anoxybacillus gonensis]|nr:hypothetical protein [Anoxybacillus gonensis]
MTYTIATGEQCVWKAPAALHVTAMTTVDEQMRYNQIEKQLAELEGAMTCDEEKLASLQREISMLLQMDGEREELQLRVRWLQQLYNVAKEVEHVKTSKDIERLQAVLATLPPSPLKCGLEETLRQKYVKEQEEATQRWLDDIIKRADSIFLNLGKEGREAIIKRLEGKQDLSLSSVLAYLREQAEQLEEQVRKLAFIQRIDLLVEALHELPFSNFPLLSADEKKTVAEQLYERQPFPHGFQAVTTEINAIIAEMKRKKGDTWGYVIEDQMLRHEQAKSEHIQYLVKQMGDNVLVFEKMIN